MNIHISESYDEMSLQAANHVLKIVSLIQTPVLCTASGDSPSGMYREFIKEINKNNTDISKWHFVGLDEWLGMNGNDEGSCRYHLDNQLFRPLKIEKNNITFFDGSVADTQGECNRVEEFLNKSGGIDVAIVGLGMNGHVGMNEPGTNPALRSHVTDIDVITQKVGQKYFKQHQNLDKGVTLGLANIMEARNIIIVVSGIKKAAIVRQVFKGEVTEMIPASLLRNHKNLSVYLDAQAATLLND